MSTSIDAPVNDEQRAVSSDDVSGPLYGASFGQAITRAFKKYARFSGLASRSEFWWFTLFNFIVSAAFAAITLTGLAGSTASETGAATPGALFFVGYALQVAWSLAVLVPGLALIWRRLHDTNRSGAFYFLAFIPFVGPIIVYVLLALPTNPANARFDV